MQKNKEISHSVISTIAISTLFIASFILSGSQFSQQALAIHEGDATTATAQNQTAQNQTAQNQTAQNQTATGGNATATQTRPAAATQEPPAAATQEPPVNQNFVRQGTVASSPGEVQGTQNLAFILPPRNDGGVYSGVLTYTASKPVGVAVLHNYDPQNSTAIPEEYGTEFTSPLPGDTGNIAIALFQPSYESGVNAASVPFTGNGLALHTSDEDGPFTATYTVNAFAVQPENANAPLEFASAEGEVEEGAAEDDAAGDEEAADEEAAAGEDTTGEGGEEEDTTGEGGEEEQ